MADPERKASGDKENASSGMKSITDFDAFKEKELRGWIEEVDQAREAFKQAKERLYYRVDFWLLALLVLTGAYFIWWSAPSGAGFVLPFIYLAYGSIVYVLYHIYRGLVLKPYRKRFEDRFKKGLLKPTISFVNENLSFAPDQKFSKETIQASLLFPFFPTIYRGEDLIKGSFRGSDIEFAEGTLIKKYSSGGDNVRTLVLFEGIIFKAELPTDLNAITVIRPKEFVATEEKIPNGQAGSYPFYKTGRNLEDPNTGKELEAVNLEDPDLEEKVDVYGNDQVKARELLSIGAMDSIKAFQEKWDGPVFLSFKGSELFVGIEFPGGLFDMKLEEGPADTEKLLDRFFWELETVHEILESIHQKLLQKAEGSEDPVNN